MSKGLEILSEKYNNILEAERASGDDLVLKTLQHNAKMDKFIKDYADNLKEVTQLFKRAFVILDKLAATDNNAYSKVMDYLDKHQISTPDADIVASNPPEDVWDLAYHMLDDHNTTTTWTT